MEYSQGSGANVLHFIHKQDERVHLGTDAPACTQPWTLLWLFLPTVPNSLPKTSCHEHLLYTTVPAQYNI
jgi:hypothetical protein